MLAVLFGFHFLESVDRWLLPAVLPQIQEGLKLSNGEAAWLTTVLLISFALASPVIGYFADRMNRRRLLATGVAVWGLAAMWTGLAKSYPQLQAARSIAGIGGATIGMVGLTLPKVIELAIEAPVSPLGLIYMLLLAYLIFTITLVLQRKQAAYPLALGLATIGLTLVFISPLGAISFVAAVIVIVGLRRGSSRAWFSEA